MNGYSLPQRKRPSFPVLHWLFTLLLVSSLLLVAGQVPSQAQSRVDAVQTVTLRVSPTSQTANVGDAVTVEVWVDGVTNLGAYQFTLNFDPAVLNATGATDGGFLGSTGRSVVPLSSINNALGTITVGAASFGTEPGPDGTGLLATVTFSAAAEGTSTLTFSGIYMLDINANPIPVDTLQGGDVTVSFPPLPTATASAVPLADAACNGTTVQVDVQVSDALNLGAFQFSLAFNPAVAQVEGVALGPFLGSTGRTVTEVPPVIDNNAGTLTYGAYTTDSDVPGPDGSGVLASVTLRLAAAGVSSLQLSDVILTNTTGSRTQPVTTVDGGVSALPTVVTVESVQGWRDTTFDVNVQIECAVNLGAYEFTLTFDPAVVNVTGVDDGSFLGSTGRAVTPLTPVIDNNAGTVSFGAYTTGDQDGPYGPGTLAVLHVQGMWQGMSTASFQLLTLTDVQGQEEDATGAPGTINVVIPAFMPIAWFNH